MCGAKHRLIIQQSLTLIETVIKRATRPTFTNKTTDWDSFRIKRQNKINLNMLTKI